MCHEIGVFNHVSLRKKKIKHCKERDSSYRKKRPKKKKTTQALAKQEKVGGKGEMLLCTVKYEYSHTFFYPANSGKKIGERGVGGHDV